MDSRGIVFRLIIREGIVRHTRTQHLHVCQSCVVWIRHVVTVTTKQPGPQLAVLVAIKGLAIPNRRDPIPRIDGKGPVAHGPLCVFLFRQMVVSCRVAVSDSNHLRRDSHRLDAIWARQEDRGRVIIDACERRIGDTLIICTTEHVLRQGENDIEPIVNHFSCRSVHRHQHGMRYREIRRTHHILFYHGKLWTALAVLTPLVGRNWQPDKQVENKIDCGVHHFVSVVIQEWIRPNLHDQSSRHARVQ